MALKRKRRVFAILIGLAVVVSVLLEASIEIQQMKRLDLIESHLAPLAFRVETYKDAHGNYPTSLDAMFLDDNIEARKAIGQELHDEFGDEYRYERLGNGFEFTVTRPRFLFVRWNTVRKVYPQGESRKEFDITVTVVTNK